MFIAQVMYAEGLKKILEAILFLQRYDALQRRITKLEKSERTLRGFYGARVVERVSEKNSQLRKETSRMFSKSMALLERCGIHSYEYEEKFRLIAADCVRISHGSVTPPEWQPA